VNRNPLDNILTILAVLVCAAGVIMSVNSWIHTREKTRQLQGQIDRLESLRTFSAPAAGSESAKAAFDSLEKRTPPELRKVIAALLPDSTPELALREPVPIRGGWNQNVANLKIRQTSMDNLARFIASVESERPPWRLTGCTISATGDQPGNIRATLTVESLSRSMDM